MSNAAVITALLGPTNTGKTHHAIERMLEHSSGMIGLPLRLLAREVYDRISLRVGESRVALVTGEEQRIPRHQRPAYWVATVEAMPTNQDVDFVAVDEIQLAAHTQRGHVFTSRLLSARGRLETWFMGADTMRGVLRELVPTARHVEHPRLSRLSYAGSVPLSRLPPRSAVVAFSMPHVYELADRIRKRRGGAAVVLGALSPRTRNAQVAMFQAGEVDCLVATDAIGMGLNLDVEHVAFAATRKFDGRDVREVEDNEIAQIAGRAGRWIHDGTFGALSPLDLPMSTVHAVETHSFPHVRRVQWRSDDLDFDSLASLRASLAEPPTRGLLRHAAGAEDAACLTHLAGRSTVASRAKNADAVRLLWDVCTIPDFRKLMLEVHVDFLEQLFIELVDRGRLRDEWIERHVRDLERGANDVEELVARIAAVRTWTYVANRSSWLDSPEMWQARTSTLEDTLSDALHERLVMRFVDVKKSCRRFAPPTAETSHSPSAREKSSSHGARPKKKKKSTRASTRESASERVREIEIPVADPSHPFAKLASLRSSLSPRTNGNGIHASSAIRPGSPDWVEDVVAAERDAFAIDGQGHILLLSDEARAGGQMRTERIVGKIVRGGSIALPDVVLVDVDDLGAGAKSRVQRRLLAHARDAVSHLMGGIGDLAKRRDASAALRGFVHRLEQGLGTTLAADLEDIVLTASDRASLEEAGVRFGAGIVYLPRSLRRAAIVTRTALASTWFQAQSHPRRGALQVPSRGAVSFAPVRSIDRAAYTAIGFPIVGPRAIRADVIDRVLEQHTAASRNDSDEGDDDKANKRITKLATWIGASRAELKKILAAASAAASVT